MIDVTKVPNSPDFLEGIINLRGKVIPLVNLENVLVYLQLFLIEVHVLLLLNLAIKLLVLLSIV